MRVAVIGANGQLGTDVCRAYRRAGHDVIALTHADVDIRDAVGVQRTVDQHAPELIVNTAAMHNVEECESDPAAAHAVNTDGVRNLAMAARSAECTLLHVSTDYVFDGRKTQPYMETDAANPVNTYGLSKLRGEWYIRDTLAEHFIVRTAGLYGHAPCRAKRGGNFVQLMLRQGRERGEVRVVVDEVVTPTFTMDLARQFLHLTEAKAHGTYHATSQGETSWFDYARTIFELKGVQVAVRPVSSDDFPKKVPRPKYSVLDNAALRAQGLDIMPH